MTPRPRSNDRKSRPRAITEMMPRRITVLVASGRRWFSSSRSRPCHRSLDQPEVEDPEAEADAQPEAGQRAVEGEQAQARPTTPMTSALNMVRRRAPGPGPAREKFSNIDIMSASLLHGRPDAAVELRASGVAAQRLEPDHDRRVIAEGQAGERQPGVVPSHESSRYPPAPAMTTLSAQAVPDPEEVARANGTGGCGVSRVLRRMVSPPAHPGGRARRRSLDHASDC